ncbi:MAG: hypothetical protein LBC73_10075 [Oscillospiraceae bacterium]|nr:hypothetical protein [Oscillospiraceae bacterium]
MNQPQIKKLANKVQTIAEELHCASAILAAEAVIKENFKNNIEKDLSTISIKLDRAIADDNFTLAEQLMNEKNELFIKIKEMKGSPHIRIQYAPLEKNIDAKHKYSDPVVLDLKQPATCIYDGDTIYIVLPRFIQSIIRNGLSIDPAVWSSEMVTAKTLLRYLTAHEIGHIIAPEASENNVQTFSYELIKRRDARDKARTANDD